MVQKKPDALFRALEAEEMDLRAQLPHSFTAATLQRVERKRRRAKLTDCLFAVGATTGVAAAGMAALWFLVFQPSHPRGTSASPDAPLFSHIHSIPTDTPIPSPVEPATTFAHEVTHSVGSAYSGFFDSMVSMADGICTSLAACRTLLVPLLLLAAIFMLINRILAKRFRLGQG